MKAIRTETLGGEGEGDLVRLVVFLTGPLAAAAREFDCCGIGGECSTALGSRSGFSAVEKMGAAGTGRQ